MAYCLFNNAISSSEIFGVNNERQEMCYILSQFELSSQKSAEDSHLNHETPSSKVAHPSPGMDFILELLEY